jgi:hypothetical protein
LISGGRQSGIDLLVADRANMLAAHILDEAMAVGLANVL